MISADTINYQIYRSEQTIFVVFRCGDYKEDHRFEPGFHDQAYRLFDKVYSQQIINNFERIKAHSGIRRLVNEIENLEPESSRIAKSGFLGSVFNRIITPLKDWLS